MRFQVTITTDDGQTIADQKGNSGVGTINKAAKECDTADGERVRLSFRESDGLGKYSEVFSAFGAGAAEAAKTASRMYRKSVAGNGR